MDHADLHASAARSARSPFGLVAALALRRPFRGRDARARRDAAAVRGAGGRGDLRLGDHAQPAVRHRQRLGHAGSSAGTGRSRSSASAEYTSRCRRPTSRSRCSPSSRSRPGGTSRSRSCSCSPGSRRCPADLEEAAMVDGATPCQRFRYIVLPQLLPVDRAARRAAVHLDLQQVRRRLPAHRRRRRHRGRQRAGVRLPDRAADIGAAAAQALVLAVGARRAAARLPRASSRRERGRRTS